MSSSDHERDLISIAAELVELFEEDLVGDDGVVYRRTDLDSMVDYAEEELHQKIRSVPKVREIFESIISKAQARKIIRAVIVGPRGGGKTRLAATLEVILFRWFGYDAQNIGGSLRQAQACYEYVTESKDVSKDMGDFITSSIMERTIGLSGGQIKVSAASDTGVRGPHPHGPEGGGLVTLDEAALIKPSIAKAALGQLASAKPSAALQLSTMGEDEKGFFWETIQNAKKKGWEVHSYDAFDVVARCPYDCETTCPVPEHFAQDYYYELGGGQRELVHEAYCAGRAHDVDGWNSIDEVAQFWHDTDRATFERELLGRSTAVVGKVYDPRTIDGAIKEDIRLSKNSIEEHDRRFKLLEKGIGHDWGWAGETCAAYGVRVRSLVIVYRWEFWSHTQYRKISEHLLDTSFEERIHEIRPDSAAPSDNDAMEEDSGKRSEALFDETGDEFECGVRPVVFSKDKQYGISEVRRRLEHETLLFPRNFGGRPVLNFDRAMEYLKAYETDQNGKPVKKDDHGPDALMCLVIGWSRRYGGAGV